MVARDNLTGRLMSDPMARERKRQCCLVRRSNSRDMWRRMRLQWVLRYGGHAQPKKGPDENPGRRNGGR